MTNHIYDIEVAEFNSCGIKSEAEKLGITHMRFIGGGQYLEREGTDNYIGFYALPHPAGWEFRVANTNSDPVWEEEDAQVFTELAENCGVSL